MRGPIHDIVLVFDTQDFLSKKSDLDKRLISFGKPKTINVLILSYEVGPLDPEREFLGGMPFDSNNGVVARVDSEFSFKQIFVFTLGRRLGDEAVVRANLLFT